MTEWSKEKKAELLRTRKEWFKLVCDLESEQRLREREDLEFQVPENQWDPKARRERAGMAEGGIPIPPRPCLSIPKLDQPIQLVLNQERNAHLGVNVHPLSPEADEDVAEVIQGIYRQIERDSQAPICRSWAFDRAVKAGRGRYRVNTKWAEEGTGHPFDQEITIERILHQNSVYWDPAAQKADYSDAMWCFLAVDIPVKRFREMYKDSDAAPNDPEAWADQAKEAPDWVTGDHENGGVRVVEHFWVEMGQEKLVLYDDGSVIVEGSKDKPAKGAKATGRVREREVRKVMYAKLSAAEVLEGPAEWPGKYIPIIEVPGKELQPFDSKRIWYGMVRPARDGQKGYNYAVSGAVEMAALEPKVPWIVAEGQVEDFKEWWEQSNIRNFSYLPYKPITVGDQQAPPPQRAQVDMSRLGPSMALVNQFNQDIQAATATFDPALGNLSTRDRSGKAILALQNQADAGNSHYVANLVNISMMYEAKVVLDLIPRIYDRPGRIARVLDMDESTSKVILNVPFVRNPETDEPEEVKLDATGQHALPPSFVSPQDRLKGQQPPKPKIIDLKRGIYGVHISIGRSYQTRLQQGADEIGKILEAQPNLMPLIGPIYFKYRDFPGAEQIAEILGRVRDKDPAFQGIGTKEGELPSAEQAMGMVNQLQQKLQQLMQAYQKLQQQMQAKVVEGKAKLAQTEAQERTKLEIAQLESETKVMVEQMKLKAGFQKQDREQQHETKQSHFEAAADLAGSVVKARFGPEPQPQPGEPLEPEETV